MPRVPRQNTCLSSGGCHVSRSPPPRRTYARVCPPRPPIPRSQGVEDHGSSIDAPVNEGAGGTRWCLGNCTSAKPIPLSSSTSKELTGVRASAHRASSPVIRGAPIRATRPPLPPRPQLHPRLSPHQRLRSPLESHPWPTRPSHRPARLPPARVRATRSPIAPPTPTFSARAPPWPTRPDHRRSSPRRHHSPGCFPLARAATAPAPRAPVRSSPWTRVAHRRLAKIPWRQDVSATR